MKKLFCDRCRKHIQIPIDGSDKYGGVTLYIETINGTYQELDRCKTYDLCLECVDEVLEKIDELNNEVTICQIKKINKPE